MSLKQITENVVDRNNARIVATASTVAKERDGMREVLQCKSGGGGGEILAMRLKVEGLEQGQGRGIHADARKEIKKKGFKSQTKVWALINVLKNNGVKIIIDDNNDDDYRPY